MVAHVYSPRSWEAEVAGSLQVQGQCGLHVETPGYNSKILFLKTKKFRIIKGHPGL